MWHALRAELAYFRPWLLGGLGIAAGVIVMIQTVFFLVGEDGPPDSAAAFLRGFFPVIAGMVVGFIAQSLRCEERRARLFLAGPLTPRQLAGVTVLLPAMLFGIGVLASGLVFGVASLITGELDHEAIRKVSTVSGMLFVIVQIGPLAQESSAARRQQRTRAAIAGWGGFVLAILLLTAVQLNVGSTYRALGRFDVAEMTAIAVMAMVATVVLHRGRTDFTR